MILAFALQQSQTVWEKFVQQVFIGLTQGMLIGLVALGYTMVYGIIELINFAHGDLVMLGCFLALTLMAVFGVVGAEGIAVSGAGSYLWIGLLVVAAALFCGGLNVAANRLAYQPLRNAPKIMLLVTAIGVSFIFMNLGQLWGGIELAPDVMGASPAGPKSFPQLAGSRDMTAAGGLILAERDILVWAVTVPLMIALTLFVQRSRLGRAMRAVAQDTQAAQLMGVNVDGVIAWTFFIGGALGGVGGVIYANYNGQIVFTMGYALGMSAFTAAVLGGIGSLPGAVVGALVIGLVRTFTSAYLSEAWTDAVMYLALVLLLIFRPSGLLGSAKREKV